jgi:hypothetical protein
LFLDGPADADEVAVVGIGGGSGGAVGACYCGGDWAAGSVGVCRGGDTTSGGDATLSACMKSSLSSYPTALWSCGEWIDGLGEVLDLKKKRTRYIHD